MISILCCCDARSCDASTGSGPGLPSILFATAGVAPWLSLLSSAKISSRPATRALFPAFFMTYSRRPALRLGCLSTSSRSCSLGNCSSAPKLAGAINFAQRMKPSQSGATVQIFFVMSRVRSVLDTKGTSDRYVETA